MQSGTEFEQGKRLSELNKLMGVLIFGHKPAVNLELDGVQITSGYAKIKLFLINLLLFVFIALLPIFCLMVSYDVSGKFRVIIKIMGTIQYLAYAILFFAVFALPTIKMFIKKGMLVLFHDTVSISYRNILKAGTIQLPAADLQFRLYMQKGNHQKLRINHGWYVLSLCENAVDDEFIVATFKNRKVALSFSKKLSEYASLKNEIADSDGKALIADDIAKDTWDILAEKSRRNPFFTPCRADYTTGIRVCGKKQRRVIKQSLARWIPFIICFSLGIGSSVFLIILFRSDHSNLILSLMLIGFFLFLTFGSFSFICGVNSIVLDNTNKKLILKYGKWFWNKQLNLDANKLNCRTFICDKEYANKNIKPGMLVVTLSSEYKNQGIILVASDNQKHAKKVYDAIAAFLNISDNNESLEQLELKDGRVIKYSTSCVEDEQEVDRRSLKMVDENLAVLKSSYGYLFLIVFLVGVAFGVFLIVGLWLDKTAKKDDIIAGGCLGLFFVLAGLTLILWLAKRRITGFCISEGLVYSSVFANRKLWWKKEAAISDIAALQVCSVSTSEQSGNNSTRETTVYQLLAIMADADDHRKLLANYTKSEKILDEAKKLSDFLNLPLIDSTQK